MQNLGGSTSLLRQNQLKRRVLSWGTRANTTVRWGITLSVLFALVLAGFSSAIGVLPEAAEASTVDASQAPAPTAGADSDQSVPPTAPDSGVDASSSPQPQETQPVEQQPSPPANEQDSVPSTPSELPSTEEPDASAAPTPESPSVKPRGLIRPMALAGTTASCKPGEYYSMTEQGWVYKVTQTSAGFSSVRQDTSATSTTSIGSPGRAYANYDTTVNGLGIGPNGQTAYAVENYGTSIYAVKKYSAATGRWTSVPLTTNGVLGRTHTVGGLQFYSIAGAVDPATGKYLVGGFGVKAITQYATRWVEKQVWVSYYPAGHPYYYTYGYYTTEWVEERYVSGTVQVPVFVAMQYDDATNTFKPLGTFQVSKMAAVPLNGDMAFDAAGNLIVIANDGRNTAMMSIPSSEVNRARSSSTPIVFAGSQTTPVPFTSQGAVNGLAFSSDGRTYIGSDVDVWYGDFASGRAVRTDLWPADGYQRYYTGDLASCASPATITLEKDVVGRYDEGDNYQITIQQGSRVYGQATITGFATGIQAERVGALPAVTGTQYTIRETMAPGTDAAGQSVTPNMDPNKYDVTYTCTADGAEFASGTLTSTTNYSAAITVPNTPSVAVKCVIKNTPKKALIVRKQWTVDGQDLPLGVAPAGLPAGYTADLILDGDAGKNWNQQYFYPGTEDVRIAETTSAGRCKVTQSLQYFNAKPVTNTALPYNAVLNYGDNTAIVKNDVTCETKLTLVKQVEGGSAKPTEWTLTAKNSSGGTVVTGAGQATAPVTADAEYTLSESTGNPLYLPERTASGAQQFRCVELDLSGRPTTAFGFTDTPDNKVTVPRSSHIQCTIINRTATLTVQKLIDGTNNLQPDQFVFAATPAAGVSGLNPVTNIPGANTTTTANTINVRPGHNYAVTEKSTNPNLAYVNTKVQKLDASGRWVDIDPAAIKIPAGEHWTIRYVNTSPGVPPLPLTGGFTGLLPLIGSGSALALLTVAAWVTLRRRSNSELLI